MSDATDDDKTDDDKTDDSKRPAIETAIDSTRRSRMKAAKEPDPPLVSLLLRQEAALLTLLADRTDQLVLPLGDTENAE